MYLGTIAEKNSIYIHSFLLEYMAKVKLLRVKKIEPWCMRISTRQLEHNITLERRYMDYCKTTHLRMTTV